MNSRLPFKPSVQAAQVWLSEIRFADKAGTRRRLLTALQALSQSQQVQPRIRFEILELFRPYLFLLSQDLERQLMDASFPLQQPIVQAVQQAIEFQKALVRGYYQIVASDAYHNDSVFTVETRATLIHRQLCAYSLIFLRVAQAYEMLDTGFWSGIYDLLQRAEQADVFTVPVYDPVYSVADKTCVDQLTRQILLFKLANPNRYKQRDIAWIHQLLLTLAPNAGLCRKNQTLRYKFLFCLDLKSDSGPAHISRLNHAVVADADMRYLVTDDLVQAIMEQAGTLVQSSGNGLRGVSKPLLTQLLRALSTPQSRRCLRQHDSESRKLIVGLANLCLKLSGKSVAIDKEPPRPSQQGSDWVGIAQYELIPVDNDMSRLEPAYATTRRVPSHQHWAGQTLRGPYEQITSEDIWGAEHKTDANTKHQTGYPGRLVNRSDNGYCMIWLEQSPPAIRVGELVGIGEKERRLAVGVIRWLQYFEPEVLTFGVELLASAGKAVTISFSDQPEYTEEALYLPAQSTLKQPASLLIAPFRHRTGDRVTVRHGDKLRAFRLKKQLEATGAFHQYTLLKVEMDTPPRLAQADRV